MRKPGLCGTGCDKTLFRHRARCSPYSVRSVLVPRVHFVSSSRTASPFNSLEGSAEARRAKKFQYTISSTLSLAIGDRPKTGRRLEGKTLAQRQRNMWPLRRTREPTCSANHVTGPAPSIKKLASGTSRSAVSIEILNRVGGYTP